MLKKPSVTFVAVVLLLGPFLCESSPSGLKNGVINGTFGGENAAVIADDTSAHVHIGCTYGNVHQAIDPDDGGYFDVAGEHNITAHPVDLGVMHPARFSGRVLLGHIRLTVTLTDTAVVLGPVDVLLGKEPRMGPCPICRREPASRMPR